MWSYYGSKTNVVDYYPKPRHNKLIEPFAGAAKYALKHFDRDVLLVDKYDVIVKIWKWLQLCSEGDIMKLPRRMQPGESLDNYAFDCEEAKLLMGFLVAYGVEKPRLIATNKHFHRPNFINFSLQRIAKDLFKIRHWEIIHGSYSDIPNQEATWFIDPPYQFGGQCYQESSKNINFQELGTWAKSLTGQVMVCESMKANWLPFIPLAKHKGNHSIQKEGIWLNEITAIHNRQTDLFSPEQQAA